MSEREDLPGEFVDLMEELAADFERIHGHPPVIGSSEGVGPTTAAIREKLESIANYYEELSNG